MDTRPPLEVTRDGPTARVTLTRPGVHNAFDDVLVEHLTRAADAMAEDPQVRVVVLAGEGESFCAGADLRWMRRMMDYSPEENRADAGALARMFEAWHALPKPVVGRIQGAALGGGAGLVAVCDVAVASTAAVFGFTEVRLGILPAVISPFVVRKIGPGAAQSLFLTGDRMPAAQAHALGLVQRLVPPEALDEEVSRVVASLLAGSPSAQAAIKDLLNRIEGRSPEAARSETTDAIARARTSPEGQEGMRAFLEQRRATWRGDA